MIKVILILTLINRYCNESDEDFEKKHEWNEFLSSSEDSCYLCVAEQTCF